MLATKTCPLIRRNRRLARQKWGLERNHPLLAALKSLTEDFALSVSAGDVILLQGNWYVTHAGLLRIAKRNRCSGMKVQFIRELSDPAARRFAFEATVFKSKTCQGFVGYGDADPSNVSALGGRFAWSASLLAINLRDGAQSAFFVFPHSVEAAGT